MRDNYIEGMSGLIDFRSWLNACYARNDNLTIVVSEIRSWMSGMTPIECIDLIRVFCPEYPGMMSHVAARVALERNENDSSHQL